MAMALIHGYLSTILGINFLVTVTAEKGDCRQKEVFMNIVPAIGIAVGVAIGIVINVLMGRKAKKAAEKLSDKEIAQLEKRFTVRQPRARLGAGIFLIVLFCGGPLAILVFAFDQIIELYTTAVSLWDAVWPTLIMLAVFLPLMLLAIWSLLRAVVWKVQVDGDRIIFTSVIGKKTEFTFKDITQLKPYRTNTGHAITVLIGRKKIFSADQACENFYLLMSRLDSRNDQEELCLNQEQ